VRKDRSAADPRRRAFIPESVVPDKDTAHGWIDDLSAESAGI